MNPISNRMVCDELKNLTFWPDTACLFRTDRARCRMFDGSTFYQNLLVCDSGSLEESLRAWQSGWLADLSWGDYQWLQLTMKKLSSN